METGGNLDDHLPLLKENSISNWTTLNWCIQLWPLRETITSILDNLVGQLLFHREIKLGHPWQLGPSRVSEIGQLGQL